jgi:DNA-binding XRE family transcriptional regulator
MSGELDDLDRLMAEIEATRPGFREACEDVRAAHAVIDGLLAERRALGLTQTEVGRRMEVTQPTVSQFESEPSDPRLSTLQRYARALGGRIEIRFVAAPPVVFPRASGGDGRG